MALSLDVHAYDGKLLINISEDLKTNLRQPREINLITKLDIFTRNIVYISKYIDKYPDCVINYNNIVSAMSQNNNIQNIDSTNDLHADDLLYLYLTSTSIDNYEILAEQLHEITNGECSQGRCSRILQVLYAIF